MNLARVAAVARRELRATLFDPLLWGLLAAAAFATLAVNPAAMIPSGDAAVAGVQPFANSRHALAQVFALTGLLFYTFPVALLAGRAVPRDDDAGIGELLHSTPLSAAEYATGKLLGVLGALTGALLLHLGLTVAWGEAGSLVGSVRVHGPFVLAAYLGPALVFLVPGVLFTAGLAFAVGARARHPLALYGLATALFLVALGALVPRPASAADRVLEPLAALLDPWGARWLSRHVFGVDRGIDFYNHAALPFDAAFLGNRLFVLAVPALAFAAAVAALGRRVRGATTTRRLLVPTAGPPARPTFAPLADLAMGARPPGFWAATRAVAGAELAQLRGQPGPYLFAGLTAALVAEAATSARGIYDSAVLATAGGVAVGALEIVTTLGCLLILFHLVEALDRPRRLGVHGFLASAPVKTAALVAGAQLAVALVLAGVLAGATGVGLALVALEPEGNVQLGPFVLLWGFLSAPTFLAWGAFVSWVYGLTRSRSATHLAGLVALAATAAALVGGRLTWVTNWPLWGALRWSDLGAFELHGSPLAWNRGIVTALALLLGVAALLVFPRRETDPAQVRPSAQRRRRAWGLVALALLVIVPALGLAGKVRRGFEGGAAQAAEREYRRRNVEAWRGVEAGAITHLQAQLALWPDEGAVDVEGSFSMVNDTGASLARVPFTVGPGFEAVSWSFDGAPVAVEDRAGLHVLTPPAPLPPGRAFQVGFRYRAVVPQGITRNGGEVEQFIRPSGVVLDTLSPSFLPALGFIDGLGVEPGQRAEPAPTPPDFWRAELPPVAGGRPFTSRLEISAPRELTVNAVGTKVAVHEAGDRRTVVWESRHPVRFLNVVAGQWSERRRGGSVVFHHPGHDANVDEMLAALEAARVRFSEWFGPSPWPELKLAEHPDHVTRAKGFPTNIPFSEGMGFLSRSDGVPGLPTLVTAHEAAHQWWGHQLTPGRGPGADLLLEGMAHYSTLLLLEAEHGPEARRDFARTLEARYADRRRVDAERPLLEILDTARAGDESAIYDKGAWVLWMLDRQLGREAMLSGLRSFVRRFDGGRDHPAVQDLIEELRPLAADAVEYQAFVDTWLGDVVLPELRLRDLVVTPDGEGWAVSATVENVGGGTVTVDVAVLAADGARSELFSVRLAPRSPRPVGFRVDFAPARLVVDPDVEILQLHRVQAEVGTGGLRDP